MSKVSMALKIADRMTELNVCIDCHMNTLFTGDVINSIGTQFLTNLPFHPCPMWSKINAYVITSFMSFIKKWTGNKLKNSLK